MGGAVYEMSTVALPAAARRSKLYQVTIDRLLRIMVEGFGDVRGIYRDQVTPVGELAARKTIGNVLEFASIFAVGFSPLWVLAAASDVMGGSKVYLLALVTELKRAGLLSAEADVASYEELLGRLEAGSGVLADAIDVPPMTLRDAARLDRRVASPGEQSATRGGAGCPLSGPPGDCPARRAVTGGRLGRGWAGCGARWGGGG